MAAQQQNLFACVVRDCCHGDAAQAARSVGQLASLSSSKPAGLAGGYVSLKSCADWKRPALLLRTAEEARGVSVLPGYGIDHCWLLPLFCT